MKLTSTRIADLKVLEPTVYEDSRGVFFESYNQRTLAQAGLPEHFVQDNQSLSYKGVLRGLHYQIKQPQGKLVRCLRGEIFDVAVDLRKSSPSFGRWEAIRLSEQNRLSFSIPPVSRMVSWCFPSLPKCSTKRPTFTLRNTSVPSSGTILRSTSSGRCRFSPLSPAKI